MPLDKSNGVSILNVQKLSGIVASRLYPQGSTTMAFNMPSFSVKDPGNAYVEGLWWMVTQGQLVAPLFVMADVTAVDVITVVVSTPTAQTLGLRLGAKVIEYA